MQSDYFAFIASAYTVSAVAILGLVVWVVLDARARRAELKLLDASGIRRRSERLENDVEEAVLLGGERRLSAPNGSKA